MIAHESDRAIFAQLMKQFKQEWNLDGIYVADSALYSAENIQQLGELNWITLVPRSIKTAKILAESMPKEVFVESEILGYRIASCCCDYGGVRQRWLVIESEKRRNSNLKQLEKKLTKQLEIATSELKSLMRQDFACAADAEQAAKVLSRNWKYHSLESIVIETDPHYNQVGRPSKNQSPDEAVLSHDEVLIEYKGQQSSERGFRCLGARSLARHRLRGVAPLS